MPRKPSISDARTARDFRSAVVERWKKIWGPRVCDPSRSTPSPTADDEVPRNQDPLRFLGGRSPGVGRRVQRDPEDGDT